MSIRVSHSSVDASADAWKVKSYADGSVFTAPVVPSDKLAAFLGLSSASRIDITKAIVKYSKEKGLRNGANIRFDAVLADLFNTTDESVNILNLQRYLRPLYKTQAEADFDAWWTAAGKPTVVNVGFVEKPHFVGQPGSRHSANYESLYEIFKRPVCAGVSFTIYTDLGEEKEPCGCGWCKPRADRCHCVCHYRTDGAARAADGECCSCSKTETTECPFHKSRSPEECAAMCGCDNVYDVTCDYHLRA